MPQDMGLGVQPQPARLRRANTAYLAPGEPQTISRPKREKARLRVGGAAGAQPRPPPAASGRATGTLADVQEALPVQRTAEPKARSAPVARPFSLPCSASGMGARYKKGMAGVQHAKAACPPRDQRAGDPVGLRWKRLLLPSPSWRRSARRSHPTVMLPSSIRRQPGWTASAWVGAAMPVHPSAHRQWAIPRKAEPI